MPEAMREQDRSFTVDGSSFGIKGGRYVSPTPAIAGKKAARQLFRKASKVGKNNIVVYIRLKEITRVAGVGDKDRTFYYMVTKKADGTVKKFKQPDGKVVTFKSGFDYDVKSIDAADYSRSSRA